MNTSATLKRLSFRLETARYDYRVMQFDPTGIGPGPWDPYGRALRRKLERLERAVVYLNQRMNRRD